MFRCGTEQYYWVHQRDSKIGLSTQHAIKDRHAEIRIKVKSEKTRKGFRATNYIVIVLEYTIATTSAETYSKVHRLLPEGGSGAPLPSFADSGAPLTPLSNNLSTIDLLTPNLFGLSCC